MNGKLLLDTNAVVALFRQDPAIIKRLAAAAEVFLPITVVGELQYGAANSARPDENHSKLDQFAASSSLLYCDLATARQYGQVKHALRVKGRPIPENDIWIAALALQHGLTLISGDQHFGEVDGLSFEGWRET
jgi:tRNA(fMet)-specific endonuclease VapC